MWPLENATILQFVETNCENFEMEPETVKRFTFYRKREVIIKN